jgi:hypothetical protein
MAWRKMMSLSHPTQRDHAPTSAVKILVILGHPDRDSFCEALAAAYRQSAEATAAIALARNREAAGG